MDIETPVDTTQTQPDINRVGEEQLPQIRRVDRLDKIPRVIPTKIILPKEKKIIPPKRPVSILRILVIGIIFFGILGFELAVIYRYDKLNKRLYKISLSLKDRLTSIQNRLNLTNKMNDKLVTSRKGLIKNYLKLDSENKFLQYKMSNYKDNFKNISIAKLSKINLLEGDMRVAYARIEAVNVQNEVLAKELRSKNEYIQELTNKLIKNMDDQRLLVNENLQLKGEYGRLSQELTSLKQNVQTEPVEDKNANQ